MGELAGVATTQVKPLQVTLALRFLASAKWARVPIPASSGVIELAFRTPLDRIGNPAVDLGFMPARAVGADLELSRERALGDLAVNGRPGEPSPGEDGFQTDDTIWLAHGGAA